MNTQKGLLPDREPIVLDGSRPTQLCQDPLLQRLFFRFVEDWIVRESERWREPWRFLLGVRGLREQCYDFFSAGESASHAVKKLCNISFGGGTLARDLRDEILKANARGTRERGERLARTLFRAEYRAGLLWQDPAQHARSSAEFRTIESLGREEEAKLVRRGGQNWRSKVEVSSRENSESSCRAAYFMVWHWLRWGWDQPGLCFYSDEALADLLVLLIERRANEVGHGHGTKTNYYRKLRQRLGLKQVNFRYPLVAQARPVGDTGRIQISGDFRGEFVLLEPIMPTLGGRRLYPIPT